MKFGTNFEETNEPTAANDFSLNDKLNHKTTECKMFDLTVTTVI